MSQSEDQPENISAIPAAPPAERSQVPESNERKISKGLREEKTAAREDQQKSTQRFSKRPLKFTWTFWYLETEKNKSWEEMLKEIKSFDTEEEFRSIYYNLAQPVVIRDGSDYSLFKKGIKPMWEDAGNRRGGRWVIRLSKYRRNILTNLWEEVLLFITRAEFEHSAEICGAVMNIRAQNYKIAVWTANANHRDAVMKIGDELRESLRWSRQHMQYQLHMDTMIKKSTTSKSLYKL